MAEALTLRGYEPARIGPRWDPVARVVPPAVAGELERLQAAHGEMVMVGRDTIAARQWVGAVSGHVVEIRPKLDADAQHLRWTCVDHLGSWCGPSRSNWWPCCPIRPFRESRAWRAGSQAEAGDGQTLPYRADDRA